ncbi:hypothetical protein FB563_0121 [Streptomyces puniciscabiei]|uniref:Uncharacterized protein n=1 Tax=Streptomyces puniciscabiei TaxID=164348 RepID=A0A542U854_9ACTN|nr:hypothetical protein [Streptomyces puniciscabiei]TQK95243.1 hypothetical protein FB563_0121 [Streptomyces puniciscabiei]
MRTLPHTGEVTAMLGVIVLMVLEVTALATAPARDRPLVSGALIGAGTATFVVVALWHGHRGATRQRRRSLTETVDELWFTAHTLEGFPMEAVRPYLLGKNAPSLNSLYTAWVFAIHGQDAHWIQRHPNLPADVTRLLVDAARQRH